MKKCNGTVIMSYAKSQGIGNSLDRTFEDERFAFVVLITVN